jgi:beta-lactamase class A
MAKEVHSSKIIPFRAKDNGYKFISPLLFYEVPNSIEMSEYRPLANKIEKLIKSDNKVDSVSVYYRDLTVGRWFGINENLEYRPASLMKVVLMIAYLKKAETNSSILNQKIIFSKDIQSIIGVVPHDQGTNLVLNKSYSVQDLMNRMIIESDNGATYALLSAIDDRLLDEIYAELGFKNPAKNENTYSISPHNYSSFLRILYNATYLNRAMSEQALDLLNRSNFDDGLRADIDTSVKIAHKYGESVATSDDDNTITSVELHDCGIIYYPNKPYLLCIMTKGANIDDLKDVIKKISQLIYDNTRSL